MVAGLSCSGGSGGADRLERRYILEKELAGFANESAEDRGGKEGKQG